MPTEYIDVVRSDEVLSSLMLTLDCDIDNSNLPQTVPVPSLSWFKDGQLVFSFVQQLYFGVSIEESFLAQNPILTQGVFDVSPFQILSSGDAILHTMFTNIINPMLGNLAPGTNFTQARQLLLDTYLGNWTCFVNNSLGNASVEYIIREYDNTSKCLSLLILSILCY